MRPLLLCLLLCPLLLLSGCLPAAQPPPPPPAPPKAATPPPTPPGAGPYWHATGEHVNLTDTLAYYAALKTLKPEELSREYQRLLEDAAAPENRLPHLQLVLLAALPAQTLLESEEATQHLEMSRQDPDFHRDLGNLLVLLDDQLTARPTVQSQSKKEQQTTSQVSLRKFKKQAAELEACRQERDELADKLQKLQEIERSLIDRERIK